MAFSLSSEHYNICVNDLIGLECISESFSCDEKNDVIILLGDKNLGIDDRILCGAEKLEQAVKNNNIFTTVRFAFLLQRPHGSFFTWVLKKTRRKHLKVSPRIYKMKPQNLRELNLERKIRNIENAYIISNPKWKMPIGESRKKYAALLMSVKEKGYDFSEPITIMCCRHLAVKDTLQDGHHRLAAALDTKQPLVAVQFSYSLVAPSCLRSFLKKIADRNLARKAGY